MLDLLAGTLKHLRISLQVEVLGSQGFDPPQDLGVPPVKLIASLFVFFGRVSLGVARRFRDEIEKLPVFLAFFFARPLGAGSAEVSGEEG